MRKSITPGEAALSVRSPDTRALWPRIVLVAGDVVSFLVFAGVGRRTHDEASGLGALAQIAATAAPFAVGWFLVSPFVGAFRHALIGAPRRMLARTELAWLAAWPVALVLRWIFSTDHSIPLSFAIVVLLSNAVFLGVWRTLFAVVTRPKR
ncbi:MAG: DUF3054 domain-containing protein [Ktedonobacterales bacterium]